jgi:hypothetical protein
MTDRQHALLKQHLFPGDGFEAVALLLCGRARGLPGAETQRLVVNRVVIIPYSACPVRTAARVTWQTHPFLFDLLADAANKGMAIVKLHSHPTGFEAFSPTDDDSDRELFERVFPFLASDEAHGSAIMLPCGRVFGRWFDDHLIARPFSHVGKIGDDVEIWPSAPSAHTRAATQRTLQVLGEATFAVMRELRVAVVGCSGTGSIVVEQLARLGVGHLILVDPDVVEYKNLNRILNATSEDAALRRPKVEVMARAIARMGLGTTVDLYQANLLAPSTIRAVSTADVLFGCMDGVEGRNALNRTAVAYAQPYFDVGVRIDADGHGGVEDIWGTVHYIQPEGSSLMERGVYSREDLDAEALKRTDPAEYRRRRVEGYIRGVPENRPAVVSTNALYASLAVNEFLARLHRFRWSPNSDFAIRRFSVTRDMYIAERDGGPSPRFTKLVGRGDMRPLLDMPELSE